jgi:hypothetical protein
MGSLPPRWSGRPCGMSASVDLHVNGQIPVRRKSGLASLVCRPAQIFALGLCQQPHTSIQQKCGQQELELFRPVFSLKQILITASLTVHTTRVARRNRLKTQVNTGPAG